MNKIKTHQVYPIVFAVFCCTIPFSNIASAVPNILLIILITLFPFTVKKSDFFKLKKPSLYAFGGLVLFLLINMLLFQQNTIEIKIIQKIVSAIAVVFLSIPLVSNGIIKKGLIISVGVAVIISTIRIVSYILQAESFEFADGAVIGDVLIVDRLYFGFFCIVSVISSFSLFKENTISKFWFFLNTALCLLFVLLISSRIAIIQIFLLLLAYIFYSKQKLKILGIASGVILILAMAFTVNKNLGQRFFYTQSEGSNKSYIELAKGWEPRFVIWSCSYDVAISNTNLLLGNGFYGTKGKLVDCYKKTIELEDKKAYFIKERFNPHNQFIDFALSYGLIASFIFIFLFFAVFLKNYKSFVPVAYLLALASFCFIESIFQRQIGAYYFAIILSIIMLQNTQRLKNK